MNECLQAKNKASKSARDAAKVFYEGVIIDNTPF